jgi:hypothetical protein
LYKEAGGRPITFMMNLLRGEALTLACHILKVHAVLFVGASKSKQGGKRVARTISMDTTLNPTSLLARARRVANENGATLVGDKDSGRFSHDMASGEYRMVGQRVIVTITEKHWLLPWPVVEFQLRELLQ